MDARQSPRLLVLDEHEGVAEAARHRLAGEGADGVLASGDHGHRPVIANVDLVEVEGVVVEITALVARSSARWMGRGAKDMGLVGAVEAEAYVM